MSIGFDEALNNEILSPILLKSIQSRCKCGAKIEFSDSLKTAHCSNKKCIYTIINRVNAINKKLNLNISDIDIENIVKKLRLTTPYQIFMIDAAAKNGSITGADIHNIDSVMQNLEKAKQKEYSLYEIAELSGIISIENTAKAIFNGFDSVTEAYNEIDRGQLSFISERLGLYTTEASTLGVEIYNQLIKFMEEFLFAEMQLKVKKYSDYKLNIAFCDNIIPFLNKQEYIEYINSLSKFKFNYVSSISTSTDILIRNSSENNSKSRAARIINDKFVANSVNSGELNLSDIGIFRDGEVKPIGNIIYICKSDELIHRLSGLEGN